jgi:hypothetical protein
MAFQSLTLAEYNFFKLDCGTYRAIGQLSMNTKGMFTLTMNQGTVSPIEFLVLGGKIDEKIKHINTLVSAEFYVPNPIKGTSGKNIIFMQSLSLARDLNQKNIENLKQENCDQSEKFFH